MKKKKSTKSTKVSDNVNITIVKDTHVTITRERDPNDEWDGEDTYTDTTIRGFKAGTQYFDFIVKKPVKDTYYLVVVNYDTGDSFHRDGNRMELVSLVENYADAVAIRGAINKDGDGIDRKATTLKVELPILGTTEEIYTGCWTGYFERFIQAEIHPVCVVDEN